MFCRLPKDNRIVFVLSRLKFTVLDIDVSRLLSSLIMKTPNQCESMSDIRAEIDRLDHQVIALLGQRFAYVKAASKFKTSETTVKAPERLKAMLQQRRVWAKEEGLSADAIEKMYQDLVNHFIDEEMKHWKQSRNK